MTLILELPPEIESKLRREAEKLGLEPSGYVLRLLQNHLPGDEDVLTEIGDYLDRLTDYEQRLARGEIQWR